MIRTLRTLKAETRRTEPLVKEEKRTVPSVTLKLADSLPHVCNYKGNLFKPHLCGDTWHVTQHTLGCR